MYLFAIRLTWKYVDFWISLHVLLKKSWNRLDLKVVLSILEMFPRTKIVLTSYPYKVYKVHSRCFGIVLEIYYCLSDITVTSIHPYCICNELTYKIVYFQRERSERNNTLSSYLPHVTCYSWLVCKMQSGREKGLEARKALK